MSLVRHIVEPMANLAVNGALLGGGGFGAWRFLLWITNRFDQRQAQLDAEDAALNMGWKEYRLLLEERFKTIEVQNRALRLSFEHVAGALIRKDPQNPALATADRIMTAAFGNDFTILSAQAGAAVDRHKEGEAG